MASAIVRYPARGQAPEIYATRVKPEQEAPRKETQINL